MQAQFVQRSCALTFLLGVAACNPSASARSTPSADSAPGSTATARAPTPALTSAANDSIIARTDAARIQGSPSAKVWVIEISDFQCPYCRQWHEENYAQIKREYVDAGKVRFAYLNFPLSMHRHAWPAAEYAMCAGAQGKFWPMHDALFTSQPSWEGRTDATPVFDSLATRAGVDMGQLHTCVQSHVLRPLIQADMDRSTQNGTNSTPTVVIGNQKLVGVQPIGAYRSAIDSALGAAPAKKP